MITDIEDYFLKGCGRCDRFATPDCSTHQWKAGLESLRSICLSAGLTETLKWGHPCYMHAGRNIAIIGAFRNNFRLSFFNAALMKDPEAVLEQQGQNTEHADMLRFTDNVQVAKMKPIILAYLQEAMAYADAGIKAPAIARELELPDELVEALDSDPELTEAFHSLTPGRQKSYAINLASAKKSETRTFELSKLKKFVPISQRSTD